MAATWTTIPTTDVDVDSPVTVALMTALRDNPEGIAQRATGAPKIWGVPYDYQEFPTSPGTWTKPSNAETGDKVIVQVVAGGGSGDHDSGAGNASGGGGGGGGGSQKFDDIDDLDATEPIIVGAGGAAQTSTAVGQAGGDSSFGTLNEIEHVFSEGGGGGTNSGGAAGEAAHSRTSTSNQAHKLAGGQGGDGNSGTAGIGQDSIYGGGGGGGTNSNVHLSGGLSARAGNGGNSNFGGETATEINGAFPGGGGGGTNDTEDGGAGGSGIVRVWCVKEE